MIYKKFKDVEMFNNPTHTAYEYNIEDKDINFCIATIQGRVPVKGRFVNLECKELIHVLNGNGTLVVENKRIELEVDDVVLIDKGERYYWEGNMRVSCPCSPAWFPEQHKIIED